MEGLRCVVLGSAGGIGRAISGSLISACALVWEFDASAAATATMKCVHPGIHAAVVYEANPQQVDAYFDDVHDIFGGLGIHGNNGG